MIKVEIYYIDVYNIYFEGIELLILWGIMKIDYFVLFIWDGVGFVKFDLDCIFVYVDILYGWGDYILIGMV